MAKKKERRLSIQQYADSIINEATGQPFTRQLILWRINNNKPLPGVKSYEKIGKAYVITVNQ